VGGYRPNTKVLVKNSEPFLVDLRRGVAKVFSPAIVHLNGCIEGPHLFVTPDAKAEFRPTTIRDVKLSEGEEGRFEVEFGSVEFGIETGLAERNSGYGRPDVLNNRVGIGDRITNSPISTPAKDALNVPISEGTVGDPCLPGILRYYTGFVQDASWVNKK